MKTQLYSIYDKTGQTYGLPFAQHSDTTALRAFKMEVNRPAENNIYYHNAADFSLMHVGYFETETGILEGCQPRELAKGDAIVMSK